MALSVITIQEKESKRGSVYVFKNLFCPPGPSAESEKEANLGFLARQSRDPGLGKSGNNINGTREYPTLLPTHQVRHRPAWTSGIVDP